MIYLSLLFFVVFSLYVLEHNLIIKKRLIIIIILFPAFFIYFLVQATQYGVGSDYFVYKSYYFNPQDLELYFKKKELGFYYIYNFFISLKSGSQSIFYFFSFLNTLILSFLLKKLKESGFIIWILFFVFFTSTGLYHSQMNGLRHYSVIVLFPIIAVFLFESKKTKHFFTYLTGFLFHSLAMLGTAIYIIWPFKNMNKKFIFVIFLVSPFVYYLSGNLVVAIIETVFPFYIHYIGNATPISLSTLVSKFYNIPIFLCFWYLYLKSNDNFLQFNQELFKFFILVFSLTYWSMFLILQFSAAYRFFISFVFFSVFPMYYVLVYFYKSNKIIPFMFWGIYLLLPYLMKVTFLAKGEYLYDNYLFRF